MELAIFVHRPNLYVLLDRHSTDLLYRFKIPLPLYNTLPWNFLFCVHLFFAVLCFAKIWVELSGTKLLRTVTAFYSCLFLSIKVRVGKRPAGSLTNRSALVLNNYAMMYNLTGTRNTDLVISVSSDPRDCRDPCFLTILTRLNYAAQLQSLLFLYTRA